MFTSRIKGGINAPQPLSRGLLWGSRDGWKLRWEFRLHRYGVLYLMFVVKAQNKDNIGNLNSCVHVGILTFSTCSLSTNARSRDIFFICDPNSSLFEFRMRLLLSQGMTFGSCCRTTAIRR
jgi:hypothetical protein